MKTYLLFNENASHYYSYGTEKYLKRIHDGDCEGFHLLAYDPSTMTIHDVLECHDGYTASCEITKEDFDYLATSDHAYIGGGEVTNG
jgi:hypothetical protein